MEEQLISFETAKLAKEKGFNISTQKAYIGESLFVNFEESFGESEFYFDADDFYNDWNKKGWFFDKKGNGCFGCNLDNIKWFEAYAASTQSLLQKWLREIHNIDIVLDHVVSTGWYYRVYFKNMNWSTPFKKYEEALEQGLLEALKLIK